MSLSYYKFSLPAANTSHLPLASKENCIVALLRGPVIVLFSYFICPSKPEGRNNGVGSDSCQAIIGN